MYCVKCGKANKQGARFCSSCGAPLEERAQRDLTPTPFADAVKTGKEKAGGFAVILRENRLALIAALLAVFVAAAFALSLSGSFGTVAEELSRLDSSEAGWGTAVYLACAYSQIVFAMLVILAIIASIMSPRIDCVGPGSSSVTAPHIVRTAYFPAASMIITCVAIATVPIALSNIGMNDKLETLSMVLGQYGLAAVVCAALGIATIVMLVISNRKAHANENRAD